MEEGAGGCIVHSGKPQPSRDCLAKDLGSELFLNPFPTSTSAQHWSCTGSWETWVPAPALHHMQDGLG
jgi:hypothetical protein